MASPRQEQPSVKLVPLLKLLRSDYNDAFSPDVRANSALEETYLFTFLNGMCILANLYKYNPMYRNF